MGRLRITKHQVNWRYDQPGSHQPGGALGPQHSLVYSNPLYPLAYYRYGPGCSPGLAHFPSYALRTPMQLAQHSLV